MDYSGLCNIDRAQLIAQREERYIDLFRVDFELFNSGRPVDVACNKQRTLSFRLELACQLGGGRCLAGALETGHHYDGHSVWLHSYLCHLRAHERDHLLVDDLNDHLGRVETVHDVCADCGFCHVFCELLDDFEIDICLKESHLDFLHGVLDIFFCQAAFGTQLPENVSQFFSKAFKCHVFTSFYLSGGSPRFYKISVLTAR